MQSTLVVFEYSTGYIPSLYTVLKATFFVRPLVGEYALAITSTIAADVIYNSVL